MSDRIAVFNDGKIQQLAKPADLYERPDNAFVAQFIGENNRLSGKVTAVNGTECSVEVAGNAVKSLKVNISGQGDISTLSIRPEQVQLSPPPGALRADMLI